MNECCWEAPRAASLLATCGVRDPVTRPRKGESESPLPPGPHSVEWVGAKATEMVMALACLLEA